jgi:GNAT superfamily N-acetyltransferase
VAPAETAVADLLDWDTKFWGERIGRVRGASVAPIEELDAWARANAVACLYFLADGRDPEAAHAAEESGFRLMDVRVELERPAERGALAPGVREARPDELDQLRAIASASHGVTRFYADPNFADERCDELYETWITTSFEGWAAGVLVAEGEGGPVGYASCHLSGGVGSIGLIAVDADVRRGGIGVALSESAVAWCADRGAERMTVATQARNIPAMRTFARTGFLVTSIGFWFHKWYR